MSRDARGDTRAAELRAAFMVLSRAVRSHELITRNAAVPRRPADRELYSRLRELERRPRLVLRGARPTGAPR